MQKIALVVDDSKVVRMTLRKLLISHSLEVVEVGSGEEAIAHLQTATTRPYIIFMDVMMDGMDDLTATRQIKSDSALSSIPVVICTGSDSQADHKKALAAGAMAVLSKPPNLEALTAILAKFESEPLPEPEAPQMEPSAPIVDEAALIANVMAQIELDLVPKLHQDVQAIAQDTSRQIAADTAEEMITNQVASRVDDLLPNMSEQLIAQSTQAIEELAQQVSAKIAREMVAELAQQAVQANMSEIDLPAQVLQTLSAEGVTWLRHQEQQIYKRLNEQLEQAITSSIQQHLKTDLTPLVTPLVSDLVNVHLAHQMAENDQALKQLGTKMSQLKRMIIGLGVVVLALVGIVLSTQFNLF